MEGMGVGTFPWHPSPSFFLVAVTVLARRGRRGEQQGPEQSTLEPREGTGLAALPQDKVHPWAAAPQPEGQARKATNQATLGDTHWQRLLPRLSPSSKNPRSNRRPAQLAKGAQEPGHPPEGEGQGTGGTPGADGGWQGVDVPTSTQMKQHVVCRALRPCDTLPTHSSHKPPMLGAGTQTA